MIDPLPTPVPTRDDPANFAARADAFLSALPTFATQTEAARVEINTNTGIASAAATTATTQAGIATTKATAAAASATAAAAAPAAPSTSTTSLVIGTGAKSVTTQTGKLWAAGAWVTVARTSDPLASRMLGLVTAYNTGTGQLDFNVPVGGNTGTGTFTDWTISGASAPTDFSAVNAAIALKQDIASASRVPINSQTGTAYTLVATDVGKNIMMANAAANAVTVPTNATVPFAINEMIFVTQLGAGQTSVVAAAGVTISRDGGLKVGARYKSVALQKIDTDTWLLLGGIA